MPRWYYDQETGKCHQFIYGGCGGNGNRYSSEEECLRSCRGHQQATSEACDLPAETGVCRGFFPRYFFDRTSGTCKKFVYGGCGGNENNFETIEDCLSTCAAAASSPCEEEKVTGPCFAAFRRFYFNKATGKCEKFTYGGCQGNSNNFLTKEDCQAVCPEAAAASSPCEEEKVVGPCRAAFRRFFFNKETGKCEKFIYGGCSGNSNNFHSKEDCQAVCPEAATASSPCEEEKVVGPCKAAFRRFFFNKATGKCETFTYGGCSGNSNNFHTKEDCQAVCPEVSAASSPCEQEKVTGPCRGFFPRFYFNKETGKCENFVYGGCQGNSNNFETEEECQAVCPAV
jgi:hypothetical protein